MKDFRPLDPWSRVRLFMWGLCWVLAIHLVYAFYWGSFPAHSYDGRDVSLATAALIAVVGGTVSAFSGLVLSRLSGPMLLLVATTVFGVTVSQMGSQLSFRSPRVSPQNEAVEGLSIVTGYFVIPATIGWLCFRRQPWTIRAVLSGSISALAVIAFVSEFGKHWHATAPQTALMVFVAGLIFGVPGSPPRRWTIGPGDQAPE